ncbi:MAG: ABC transporter permease [Burkholderiales bacterium]|nr:ABC transporter permease [Burkholderiales bacterium]
MPRLEARPAPSPLMGYLAPVLALGLTVVFGTLLFLALGKSPVAGLRVFFVTPLETLRGWSEVGLKMVPLLLCALGLAICYRSNVWNIGAEGQFVVGGIAAGGVALLAGADAPRAYFVIVLAGGIVGGLAWAGVTAFLRDRFNANEILVSLMLTYVGGLLLIYLVNGPWKDPKGFNFPYSKTFDAAAMVPRLFPGTRLTWGIVLAVVVLAAVWLFLARSKAGFRLAVAGHAPLAARFAGFSAREGIWLSLLLCGALAGLAGALEVAGPLGQLTPQISPGYGFAAIIVAWLGRLHPGGCVFAAFVMALIYIGGELSQSRLGLPAAITGVFQGMLLLALLTADTFIHYRVRWR